MDPELQKDKFIRTILEEVKYDLAYQATRSYYEIEIAGPGPGRANPNYITKILNKQITRTNSFKSWNNSLQKLPKSQRANIPLQRLSSWRKHMTTMVTPSKTRIPSFLDADQAELYKMQLEDQSYPYYENLLRRTKRHLNMRLSSICTQMQQQRPLV